METRQAAYIGVDLSAGRKGFTYVAIDAERRLLAQCQGDMQEVLAFAAGQPAAWVALSAPASPNQGLLSKDSVRQRYTTEPPKGRAANLRLCEYELELRGLQLRRTPGEAQRCPAWMRRGFELYAALNDLGYQPYPNDDATRQYLETPAEAVYWALMGCAPFPGDTLESRLQRQLVLYDLRLPVPDPMRFFEEVTSYRLLHGILPLKDVWRSAELNALALAYTAWISGREPGKITRVGDTQEGEIVLPVQSLPPVYVQPRLGIGTAPQE